MDDIMAILAEHPLAYRSIRFVKRNDHGRPIYRVRNTEVGGAEKAMRAAHGSYGSSCFTAGR